MTVSNYQYLSDDGTVYQIAVPDSLAAAGAGDLSPATGSEPTFLFAFYPRVLIARATIGGAPAAVSIPVNATNAAWLAGPGATVTVSGDVYLVSTLNGERRVSPILPPL